MTGIRDLEKSRYDSTSDPGGVTTGIQRTRVYKGARYHHVLSSSCSISYYTWITLLLQSDCQTCYLDCLPCHRHLRLNSIATQSNCQQVSDLLSRATTLLTPCKLLL